MLKINPEEFSIILKYIGNGLRKSVIACDILLIKRFISSAFLKRNNLLIIIIRFGKPQQVQKISHILGQ